MINIMSRIKIFFLLFIFALTAIILVLPAEAQIDYGLDETINAVGTDKIVKENTKDPSLIIGSAIGYVLSFIGTIFMIAIIYGGFLWMTAKGNESQVDKAKTIMRNSIIGFVVVALAYVISTTVLNALFDIAGVTE